MMNSNTAGISAQEPARKRFQDLLAFCFASWTLGARDRKELARLVTAYDREHRLQIPATLIGETVLFVLAEGAQ